MLLKSIFRTLIIQDHSRQEADHKSRVAAASQHFVMIEDDREMLTDIQHLWRRN